MAQKSLGCPRRRLTCDGTAKKAILALEGDYSRDRVCAKWWEP